MEQEKKKVIEIFVSGGTVSHINYLPKGVTYNVKDLDMVEIEKDSMINLPDVPKEVEDNELRDHFKHYLEKYPIKDVEEFVKDMVQHCQEN